MLSQKREHIARLQQMPRQRHGAEQLLLTLSSTLHTPIVPAPPGQDDTRYSGVS